MGCGASTSSQVKKYDTTRTASTVEHQDDPAPSTESLVVHPASSDLTKVLPGDTIIETPNKDTSTPVLITAVGSLPEGGVKADTAVADSEPADELEEGDEDEEDLESDSLDDLQAKKAQLSEMLELFEKLEQMQANAEAGQGDEADFGAMMSAITDALAQMQPMGEIRVPTPKSRMPVLALDSDCSITRRAAEGTTEALETKLAENGSAAELLDAGLVLILRWSAQHVDLVNRSIKSAAVGLIHLMAAAPADVAFHDGEAHHDDAEELAAILEALRLSFLACKAMSSAEVLLVAVQEVPEVLGTLIDCLIASEKAPNAVHYLCRTVLVAAECCSESLVEVLCEADNKHRLASLCRMVQDIAVEELLRELLSGGTCQFVAVRVAMVDAGVVNLLLHNYGLGDDCPEALVPDGDPQCWAGATSVLSEMLWCADTVEAALNSLVAKAAPQLSHPQAAELMGAPLRFASESDVGLEGSMQHLAAFVDGCKGHMHGKTRLLCVEWFSVLAQKSWKAASEIARSGAVRVCVAACRRKLGNTLLHVRTHNMVLSVLRHCIHSAESGEAAVAQLDHAELLAVASECTSPELRTFVVAWVRVLQEWSQNTPAVEEWLSAQQPQWSLLEGWAEDHPLLHRAVLIQMGLVDDDEAAEVPTDSEGSPLIRQKSTDVEDDFVPVAD